MFKKRERSFYLEIDDSSVLDIARDVDSTQPTIKVWDNQSLGGN
jgi:hypothetical protein